MYLDASTRNQEKLKDLAILICCVIDSQKRNSMEMHVNKEQHSVCFFSFDRSGELRASFWLESLIGFLKLPFLQLLVKLVLLTVAKKLLNSPN